MLIGLAILGVIIYYSISGGNEPTSSVVNPPVVSDTVYEVADTPARRVGDNSRVNTEQPAVNQSEVRRTSDSIFQNAANRRVYGIRPL